MLELALSEDRAAAGAVVHGRVRAPDQLARATSIELLRLERSPVGVATYRVATAAVTADGSFELSVPDGAPPDVEGRDCSLHYAVRAHDGTDESSLRPFAVSL
jgi:hypothetical protein